MLNPSLKAQEMYALFCVPDITHTEATGLTYLLSHEIHLYTVEEAKWLLAKADEVGRAAHSRNLLRLLKPLQERAKKAKKELPPADNTYTDYEQAK